MYVWHCPWVSIRGINIPLRSDCILLTSLSPRPTLPLSPSSLNHTRLDGADLGAYERGAIGSVRGHIHNALS